LTSPTLPSVGTLTLDAEAMYKDLLRYVQQIHVPAMQLAGITSGGAWLVERLHRDLKLAGKPGIISSTLHRDDFSKRGLSDGGQTTLPFDVEGADILLMCSSPAEPYVQWSTSCSITAAHFAFNLLFW
jgi:pyrimidine operon attenuation protein / uracil phosphoribosyltransferase